MACYTMVRLEELEDNALNRKARRKLGLPAEGGLSQRDAKRVRAEVGVLKAMEQVRRLEPTAVIRRKGNELIVSVQR